MSLRAPDSAALALVTDIRILLRMANSQRRSYDADVPNKTIYVSEGDLTLYQRAQDLAGDNLSAAIATALRRYVDVEEGRREGFDEIIVRVGPGKAERSGSPASSWASGRTPTTAASSASASVAAGPASTSSTSSAAPAARWSTGGQACRLAWLLGIGNVSYGSRAGRGDPRVVATLEELRDTNPAAALRHGRRPPAAAGGRRPRHLTSGRPSAGAARR